MTKFETTRLEGIDTKEHLDRSPHIDHSEGSRKSASELSPDGEAILRYLQDKGSATRQDLSYRTHLEYNRLNEILTELERMGLAEVRSGDSVDLVIPKRGDSL